MRKHLAIAWLVVVACIALLLGLKISHGISIQTDVMALLPHGASDTVEYQVSNEVISTLSKRVVLLVGGGDRGTALRCAGELSADLEEAGLFRSFPPALDEGAMSVLGKRYFQYRSGLLSPQDRDLLLAGRGELIKNRALASIFSPMGFSQAKLVEYDPFLLFPSFLTSLSAQSAASVEDGFLCFRANGKTWVLLSGSLKGSPYDFSVQEKLNHVLMGVQRPARVLRLGTVFYAYEGAKETKREMAIIGTFSLLGVLFLLVFVFRSIFPVYFGLLVVGVGMLTGFASCLFFAGTIHSTSLLFGLSLIGVTIDYCLEYCCKAFSPGRRGERVRKVFWGIVIGTCTTLLGYFALYITPFPGLRQIAVFSLAGVGASCLTVLLWGPYLDRMPQKPMRPSLWFLSSFMGLSSKYVSRGVFILALICCVVGVLRFNVDDDVRNMQNLSAALKNEQKQITAIIGLDVENKFILIHAPSHEKALQSEEHVAARLGQVIEKGGLQSFQALSKFIPSQGRQRENRGLVAEQLYQPYFPEYKATLHLSDSAAMPAADAPLLDFDTGVKVTDAFGLTSLLLPGGFSGYHVMLLGGIKDIAAIRAALDGVQGASLVSPAETYSELFGKYRNRAFLLLGISILLIAPITVIRYGARRGCVVLAAPLGAIMLTPLWVAGMGFSITFFDALALVLVFSMGVDYVVFLEEAGVGEHKVTALAVTLSAATTCLSFGVLAFSQVQAVAHFGLSMFVGIFFSLFFAAVFSRRSRLVAPVSLCLAAFLVLGGCAPRQLEGEMPAADSVEIAPGVGVTFPSAFVFPGPREMVQNVVVDYQGPRFSFISRIGLSDDRALIVCMNPTGQRLLTIDWRGRDISYEKAVGFDQLKPENVLADIFLIYWPLDVVSRALSSQAHVSEHGNKRTLRFNSEVLAEITYEPSGRSQLGSGQVTLRNLRWGYSLTIHSKVF